MKELSSITKKLPKSMFYHMNNIFDNYDVINLSQGFTDLKTPKVAFKRLEQLSANGGEILKGNKGTTIFRNILSQKLKKTLMRSIDPENEVLLTFGASEAMLVAVLSVLNPGDKVIIFSPYYENHLISTLIANANPIFVELRLPDFMFDPDELKKAFENGAKALILCTPSNPCGKVFTMAELQIISEYIQKYDAYLITDEVYEHIVYAPFCHIAPASLPGLWERTFTCSSLSKTYSISEWHIGYIVAPAQLILQAQCIHQFISTSFPELLLVPASELLLLNQSYYDDLIAEYTRKKELFLSGLDSLKLLHNNPQGAFFVLVDTSEFGYDSDVEFCSQLAIQTGVGAMPASYFFSKKVNNFIRFHYAKQDEVLINVLNRLENVYKLKK